jgi:transposase
LWRRCSPGWLSPLVIDDLVDEGEWILVRARTPDRTVSCLGCGARTGRVHGYHQRTLTDVAIDARRVVVRVRVRRLVCPTRGCRHTFREQLPGALERYQRRTPRLGMQVGVVARELAGRAGARALSVLAVVVSRHTALRALLPRRHHGEPRPARQSPARAGRPPELDEFRRHHGKVFRRARRWDEPRG